jgi:hypothetical protein
MSRSRHYPGRRLYPDSRRFWARGLTENELIREALTEDDGPIHVRPAGRMHLVRRFAALSKRYSITALRAVRMGPLKHFIKVVQKRKRLDGLVPVIGKRRSRAWTFDHTIVSQWEAALADDADPGRTCPPPNPPTEW